MTSPFWGNFPRARVGSPWFADPGHDRLWEQSMGRGTQQFLWLRKTHENILVGGFNHLEK